MKRPNMDSSFLLLLLIIVIVIGGGFGVYLFSRIDPLEEILDRKSVV